MIGLSNGDNHSWYCDSCSIEVLSSEAELRSKSRLKAADGGFQTDFTPLD
jgi:hypothetical protein